VPEPDGRRWQRLDCSFCDDTNQSAAVNHDAGWFECYRESCRKVIHTGRDCSAVKRFDSQIRQAANNVHAKYGGWVSFREAESVAQELVLGYANGKPGGPNDAGRLPDWEMDCKGDPDQLDRFVLHALNCDLLDYAKVKGSQGSQRSRRGVRA
jgi:hypothetical protein